MAYKNSDELCRALFNRMEEIDDLKGDPVLVKLAGLWKAYAHARDVLAPADGWVGVGCITFAENYIQKLQEKQDG